MAAEPGRSYSDGHPQDVVQYLEAKLILKPDRFTSVQSFRDFGKLVQSTAKKQKVGFVASPAESGLRPEIREIIFVRHAGLPPVQQRLHPAAAQSRTWTAFRSAIPEIVFKFRHPDEETAAALDVRPKI